MADTSPQDKSGSEYRIVHPERESRFTDAGYIPQSEAPEIRSSRFNPPPAPEPKPEKKTRRGISAGTVVALCLICGLLGGAVGGLGVSRLFSRFFPDTEVQETEKTVPEAEPTFAESISPALPDHAAMAECCVGVYADGKWLCSGCVIAEGYVLAPASPLSGKSFSLRFADGTESEGTLVGRSVSGTDAAVLRTDSAVSPVTVGSLPKPGESIFALAATENAAVMTEGIVSTESFSLAEQGEMQVFAADIRCESVGAVIFDSAGRAVGLTVRCGENALPLAVPMEEAKAVAESIIESGADSGRAALGIVGESVSSGVAQYYDMTRGVYIWSVTPGSGAERAGLRSGDIITALGDTEITDTGDLSLAERGYNAGDTGILTLYRGGESITVEVTFDNQ